MPLAVTVTNTGNQPTGALTGNVSHQFLPVSHLFHQFVWKSCVAR